MWKTYQRRGSNKAPLLIMVQEGTPLAHPIWFYDTPIYSTLSIAHHRSPVLFLFFTGKRPPIEPGNPIEGRRANQPRRFASHGTLAEFQPLLPRKRVFPAIVASPMTPLH